MVNKMKKRNIITTVILVVIAICIGWYGYFDLLRNSMISESSQPESEVDETSASAEEIFETSRFSEDFYKAIKNTNDTILNADPENYYTEQEAIKNFKTLFERDCNLDFDRTIHVLTNAIDSKYAGTDISYHIENLIVTNDADKLSIDENATVPMRTSADGFYYEEDGKLFDDCLYLDISVEIENESEETIKFEEYGEIFQLIFSDEEGNLLQQIYQDDIYVSFQPGVISKRPYLYTEFKPGEVLEVDYVAPVPLYAINNLETCLYISNSGKAELPVEQSQLVNLTSRVRDAYQTYLKSVS